MQSQQKVYHHQHRHEFVTPFGTLLGSFRGVEGYSNGSDRHFSAQLSFSGKTFYGVKYQCVEYARRWLINVKHITFASIPTAADVWTLDYLDNVETGDLVHLHKFANGGSEPPKAEMILIWDRCPESPPGHIAIITDVSIENGYVRVAEQNLENDYWPGDYARQIPLVVKEGKYFIEDEDPILGWLQTDTDRDLAPPVSKLVSRKSFQPKDIGTSWLDQSEPVYANFATIWGENSVRIDELHHTYYEFHKYMADKIKYATMELHRLWLRATEAVLKDDNMMEKFGIPKDLWPLFRESWEKNPFDGYMMGRFDMAINGKSLKVYELNADCPACLLETADIQDRWAKAVGCDVGTSAGQGFNECLKEFWTKQQVNYRVHFLIDTDPEEMYNALYLKKIVNSVNIDVKISVRCEGLTWKDDGLIYDDEGHQVKLVWKMFMWETIFDDREEDLKNPTPKKGQPRLSHVTLHPNVRVIEPMWRSIAANKAMLVVMWKMFPDHPFLLHADWELDEYLSARPFISKPVVGRCGKNVVLYQSKDAIMAQTDGEFANRQTIYQEFFQVQQFDDYYPIVGSWFVNKRFGFAGFGVREEKHLITQGESPFACCRVITDQ